MLHIFPLCFYKQKIISYLLISKALRDYSITVLPRQTDSNLCRIYYIMFLQEVIIFLWNYAGRKDIVNHCIERVYIGVDNIHEGSMLDDVKLHCMA